jgi:hypothetical protein
VQLLRRSPTALAKRNALRQRSHAAPLPTLAGVARGRCYDETSCNYRYKNAGYSMSSATWKDSFKQGGIFENNPVKSPIAGVRRT